MNSCFFPWFFLLLLSGAYGLDVSQVPESDWIKIFNGTDLEDWVPKIRYLDAGEDPYHLWKAVDSILWVDFTGWEGGFDDRISQIAYQGRTFSHYIARVEYQFYGEQIPGAGEVFFQNNGLLYHCRPMEDMDRDQRLPACIEVQLLGEDRGPETTTGNVCMMGNTGVMNGERRNYHCSSAEHVDINGLEWVTVEVLVLGDSVVKHIVMGDTVLTYTDIRYKDGEPMREGFLAVQAESHPTKFKTIEVLDLVGCMDSTAINYRDYYVKNDPDACVAPVPGCLDSGYAEFNPDANVHMDDSCRTLASERRETPADRVSVRMSSRRLSVSAQGAYELELSDIRGVTVKHFSGTGNSVYRLYDLNPGVYFVRAKRPPSHFLGKVFCP